MEGKTVTYVCWSARQRERCDEEINITAVCNKQGKWDPSTDDICAESTGISWNHVIIILN